MGEGYCLNATGHGIQLIFFDLSQIGVVYEWQKWCLSALSVCTLFRYLIVDVGFGVAYVVGLSTQAPFD
jgi:hypothetical protein